MTRFEHKAVGDAATVDSAEVVQSHNNRHEDLLIPDCLAERRHARRSIAEKYFRLITDLGQEARLLVGERR